MINAICRMDSLEQELKEIECKIVSLKKQIGTETPNSLQDNAKKCNIAAYATALGEHLLNCEKQINRLRRPFMAFTALRNQIRAIVKPRNRPIPKVPHAHIALHDRFYTIVLAANETYTPYMAVLIHSIITCATNAKIPPPPNHIFRSHFIS